MPVNDVEHRLTILREEIEQLKVALHTTSDEELRQQIFARISECFKESIGLVEQRIRCTAAFLSTQRGLPHAMSVVDQR
jgi:hypothetical protein